MPILMAILTKLLTDRALGVLAIRALDEAAKRTGATGLHDAVHFVAPILGVDLPADIPAPSPGLIRAPQAASVDASRPA